MKPAQVYLFVLLLFVSLYVCESTISRSKVLDIARQFCTGQDICNVNNSQADTIQSASSCCSQCSCEPSCKEYGNCCFPDDSYLFSNIEDRPEKSVTENSTSVVYECLYPSSQQPTDSFGRIQQQSFWMVKEITENPQFSRNRTCGNLDVAPWGSLLPVSSKKTGHIYKNIICAREHYVKEKDIVVWPGVHYCKYYKRGFIELSEAFLETCQKYFFPPNGIAIRRSTLCYNNLIGNCSFKDFGVPINVHMSQSEVMDACTSGFLSPYRQVDMFSNIFCQICNGYTLFPYIKCQNLLSSPALKSGGYITGLIDYNYLQSLSHISLDKRDLPWVKMACLVKDAEFEVVGEKCKLVRCPFGQTRNSKGKCIYGTTEWSNIIFQISLQLRSFKPFNIRQYFPNFYNSKHVDISNLKSSFRKLFTVDHIHYKQLKSETVTDELVIFMSKLTPTTSTKRFMNTVKKNINEEWLLKSYNTTLTLTSKLTSGVFSKRDRYITHTNTSYKTIYYKLNKVGKQVMLSKLYFCENIELKINEFNESNADKIVFNKISNRFLFANEFSLDKTSSEETWTCHVCLHESGYKVNGKNHSVQKFLSFGLFISVINVIFIIL